MSPAMSMPVATTKSSGRMQMILGGLLVVALAMAAGILAGLALRSVFITPATVTPGLVATVTDPKFARITEAKTIAASGGQTLQVGQGIAAVQNAQTAAQLQPGQEIEGAQYGLSSYDAQGSVNIPAR